MIFHESMYHNMRIHVIFLALYFLPYLNLIRHHTIIQISLYRTRVLVPGLRSGLVLIHGMLFQKLFVL